MNSARKASVRSAGAQAVIDRYALEGLEIPKNASMDALHSDHVFKLTATHLERLMTRQQWWTELVALTTVVCVTAAENYALERVERAGADGWDKYSMAGVELLKPTSAG